MSRGAPTRVRGGVGRVGGAQTSQPTQAAAGWCERGLSRFGDRTHRRSYFKSPLEIESSDSLAYHSRLGGGKLACRSDLTRSLFCNQNCIGTIVHLHAVCGCFLTLMAVKSCKRDHVAPRA